MPRPKLEASGTVEPVESLTYSEEISFEDAVTYEVLPERIRAAAERASYDLFDVQELETALPFSGKRTLKITVTIG